MASAITWPLRVVISSPVRMSRSSPHSPCHALCAAWVLCSLLLMKSSPAARAAVAISAGVRLPSEWTECRWQSPRYQARPRPLARSGGYTGVGVVPGSPKRRVIVTSYGSPSGATVYGPSAMFQVPARTGPAT